MAGHSPQLLLIEDDELIRKWTVMQLSRLGYHVDACEDAESGLTWLLNNKPELILLDINLPGMNGLQMLAQIRKQFPILSLPVVMVTAEEDAGQIVNALRQGANDYIVKPINPAVADARIKTQLTLKHYAALKDDAVRFASHDLKKPLLLLQDMLVELQDELRKPDMAIEECQTLGELMQKTTRQMDKVVHGFLQQNTLLQQKDIRDTIDINKLVQDIVLDNTGYAKQKQIEIHTQLAESLPTLQSNSFALRQIIENLLGNAIKFCTVGNHARLTTEFDDKYIKLSVSDSGPGLSPDDFDNLFVPGKKLGNKPTGNETSSGIGLVLCKQFIEQLGGEIGACNNPDRGVSFWISLPRTTPT